MPLELERMVEEFYDYFLDLYNKERGKDSGAAPTAGEPFLAFATVGTPITPEMFKLKDGSFHEPLVVEQFSLLANPLPEVDGTAITAPGLLSADDAYASLLAQAQPLTAADAEALGAIKGPAEKSFAEAPKPPLVFGGEEYYPALPLPPNFPLPEAESVWTTRAFTQTETTVVAPPAPPRPGPRPGVPRPTLPWRWRVAPAELSSTVKSLKAVEAVVPPRVVASAKLESRAAVLRVPPRIRMPTKNGPAPTASVPVPAASPRVISAAARLAVGTRVFAPPVRNGASPVAGGGRPPPPQGRPFVPVVERADVMRLRLEELRKRSQPQAVTSKSLTLSFQYCLVTARRPWLSGAFLHARNWFVPRMRAGEAATGTGTGEGAFEAIPTAALCVRNLSIKAEWSAEETAMLSSATKFGPFSLVGRDIEATTNSLTCAGIQVIGWIFEPLPCLPPNSDPALAS